MKIKSIYINNQVNFVFSIFAGFLLTVGFIGVFFDAVYAYLLIAGIVWGIFSIYYGLNKNTDLLEPINFIFLDVFGGTICRLIYMFCYPDRSNVTQFLLLGKGIHIAVWGGILIVFGLCFMIYGYILGKRNTRFSKWKKGFFITGFFTKEKRLPWVMLGLLFVSAIGLFIFYKIFGVGFFTSFTKKFTIVTDDEGDATKNGLGIPRLMLLQSRIAFLVYATWFYVRGKKMISWHGAFLCFLFIAGSAPSLFLSSRLPIIWNIFYWIALSLIFQAKGKFPWMKVFAVFFIVSLVIVIVGVLRQAGKGVSESDLDISGDSYIDKVFGNRNLLSADKAGIVFDAIQTNRYQFEYGESFTDIIIAPIPKSLWLDKPNVSLGERMQPLFVGPLGDSGSVPIGLVAEGYLEFGFIGIIGLLFVYGYLMGYMFNIFENSVKSTSVLLYFFFCYHWGFNMIGDGFEKAGSQFLIDFVPLYIILRILK